MKNCGAKKIITLCTFYHFFHILPFQVWTTPLLPRQVLDKLELRDYTVTTTTGIGQTFVICLNKPIEMAL